MRDSSEVGSQSGSDEGLERRLPRKTSVEADQRRVNREGQGIWTTGIGRTPQQNPSLGGSSKVKTGGVKRDSNQRRWDMEELSDPVETTKEDVEISRKLRRRRATRNPSTIDGVWNDRRRPERYDYYREGHPINRASKVMAACSLNEEVTRGKRKSTTLES
jgi:hypothetical protein